jgi:ferrochelatase
MKTTILLINLGTPDSPDTGAVRKYLREFLLDGRAIDMNPTGRYLLVNGLIALFRAGKKKAIVSFTSFCVGLFRNNCWNRR